MEQQQQGIHFSKQVYGWTRWMGAVRKFRHDMFTFVTLVLVEGASKGFASELPRRPDRWNVRYHHFASSCV